MHMRYRAKKGMTLMELIIAIAIALISMEGFSFLLTRSWDMNKFILEEGMASAAASRATNQVVIQLRGIQQAENGDYPIKSSDDFDLTVYANVDEDEAVERIHYFLDQANDQLKKGITQPNMSTNPPSYPAADGVVYVMMNYIINDATDPIFYYYNGNYPGDVANNPLNTPASPGAIRLIRVHLCVNINPIHAPDNINIESFVTLRNLHSYE